ncbi:MAG: hypothetical protein KZQ93_05590 [Candidatus Thiodiazotropha sp. (ex Monitilora ramsayi)]|nr:hypothetical protein [Candidatus Thiodiazotropha sp. (ex Monitilora ramsayi)]
MLGGGYDITQILYELTGQSDDFDLDRFGPDRELILAIGEQEHNITASINQSGVLTFENMDHLALLDVQDYLTIRLYQNNDAANTLWQFKFISNFSVNKLREADNYCNASPNRKQIKTGYGQVLIVATEPDKANHVQVALDGVMGDTENTRIRVNGNDGWIEPELSKCRSCKIWTVGFDVPDVNENITYMLYSYEDENENGEPFEILNYRTGDLTILAASKSSYDKHMQEYESDIAFWTGTNGISYELSRNFIMGAPNASGYQSLMYQEKEVGSKVDTKRDDYLVNSWSHGAGASMTWFISENEKCDAIMPFYEHPSGTELHDLVLQSSEFKEGLESIIKFRSFQKDILNASSCSDGEDDCFEFVTNGIDADLFFRSVILKSDAANLFAALGDCKYKYKAKVRYKDNILSSDEYDIKITGEIYDFYDFNYGKTFLGKDFNSDGAIVEIGYEGGRPQGAVFITSVPFDLTYSLRCGLLGCEYSDVLLFSEESDF